jgi:hypothetical protein
MILISWISLETVMALMLLSPITVIFLKVSYCYRCFPQFLSYLLYYIINSTKFILGISLITKRERSHNKRSLFVIRIRRLATYLLFVSRALSTRNTMLPRCALVDSLGLAAVAIIAFIFFNDASAAALDI